MLRKPPVHRLRRRLLGRGEHRAGPIRYEPLFTALTPDPDDRRFKVDISYRGLVCPGQEVELVAPYDLGLWETAPVVWVMDPYEITSEKILGWCAHRQAKHYADLGFIAIATTVEGARIELQSAALRDVLDAKLKTMRALQPTHYTRFESIDDLARDLARQPQLAQTDWNKLVYVQAHRERFDLKLLTRAVREILVPKLRQ